MRTSGIIRGWLLAATTLVVLFAPAPVPAHAVSKEMVELQTQVQQLLDAVQRLQSTLDTKMGVLQHLAEQTADVANQMTTTVNAMQQKLNSQNENVGGKVDQVSGQVQSLNDSVDELKARIAKLDKTVSDLQAQIQTMQTAVQQQQPAPGGQPPQGEPANPGQGQAPGVPGAPAAGPAPGAMGAQQAPPLGETLQAGVRDYTAGKYQVAQSEFQDILHYYPMDDAAGTAQFYLGEIAYQQKDYATAISDYNAVLEGFGGNTHAPAAQLHKGYSLLATNKKDAGIHELRALIQRYPQKPEARAARSRLNELGVKITPTPAH